MIDNEVVNTHRSVRGTGTVRSRSVTGVRELTIE